jgi:hypothetical protein
MRALRCGSMAGRKTEGRQGNNALTLVFTFERRARADEMLWPSHPQLDREECDIELAPRHIVYHPPKVALKAQSRSLSLNRHSVLNTRGRSDRVNVTGKLAEQGKKGNRGGRLA